jgi:hypothetical protein
MAAVTGFVCLSRKKLLDPHQRIRRFAKEVFGRMHQRLEALEVMVHQVEW